MRIAISIPLRFFDSIYKKTAANIGIHIFHQLLENSAKSRQSEFERVSDIRFRQWKRAQLDFDWKDKKLTGRAYWINKLSSLLYEYTCGFGYRPFNLIITTLILFVTVSVFNHWAMRHGLKVDNTLVSQPDFVDSVFYSFSLLTSLGFSTIVPVTPVTKILAVSEAMIGIGWFSLFTTVLVRRFLK